MPTIDAAVIELLGEVPATGPKAADQGVGLVGLRSDRGDARSTEPFGDWPTRPSGRRFDPSERIRD